MSHDHTDQYQHPSSSMTVTETVHASPKIFCNDIQARNHVQLDLLVVLELLYVGAEHRHFAGHSLHWLLFCDIVLQHHIARLMCT